MDKVNSDTSSSQALSSEMKWGLGDLKTHKVATAIFGVVIGGAGLYFISRIPSQKSIPQKTPPPAEEPKDFSSALLQVIDTQSAKVYLDGHQENLSLDKAQPTQVTLFAQVIDLKDLNTFLIQVGNASDESLWSFAFDGLEKREESETPSIVQALSSHIKGGLKEKWGGLCPNYSLCCKAVWAHYQDNIPNLIKDTWKPSDLPKSTNLWGMLYYYAGVSERRTMLLNLNTATKKQATLALGVIRTILENRRGALGLIDPMIKQKGLFNRQALINQIPQIGDRILFCAGAKKVRHYQFLADAVCESLKATAPEDPKKFPFESEYLPMELFSSEHVLDFVVAVDGHPKCVDLLLYYGRHKMIDHYLAALQGLCKKKFSSISNNDKIIKSIKELIVREEGFNNNKKTIAEYLTQSLEDASGLSPTVCENLRVFFREDLEEKVPSSIERLQLTKKS